MTTDHGPGANMTLSLSRRLPRNADPCPMIGPIVPFPPHRHCRMTSKGASVQPCRSEWLTRSDGRRPFPCPNPLHRP
jgi:hypothetical protein